MKINEKNEVNRRTEQSEVNAKAKLIEFTKENGLAVADFYEYSMARANIEENYFGLDAVFDLVVRNLPTTKVVGQFEHDGVTYDKLEKRSFLVNAGLEQAVAVLTQVKGDKNLRNYMENVMEIDNEKFLNFVETAEFKGDVYAMREGELFFGQEQQLRLHDTFEAAQLYETLMLATVNPQTNVATTANDIADVVNGKVLLEGGSRRAQDPMGAITNSRAAIVGGFTASSNVAYGMVEGEKVGGTHGHSYVMLHPTEFGAFKAQAKTYKENVCFLIDTYNVEVALEKAIKIVKEENLENFAFRVDSGNITQQYFTLTDRLTEAGFEREQYKLVASDDLNAGKIKAMEDAGANYDKYLVGTFLVSPPKPLGGVYKLAAYKTKEGKWVNKGKFSENPFKATLPGVKQTYRVVGEDGMFVKDVVALDGEDITKHLEANQTYEPLLQKVVTNGEQDYNPPSVQEIAAYKNERLAQLPEVYKNGTKDYPVIISDGVMEQINQVKVDVQKETEHLFF